MAIYTRLFCKPAALVRRLFLLGVSLISHHLTAQNVHKIIGPLGVYHIPVGYTYKDSSGIDSISLQQELSLGEMYIPNQAIDHGMNFDMGFEAQIDSCVQWRPNKIFGIIEPVSEDGVKNQPSDTVLLTPRAQVNGPGMIQGAQRFSKLSQLYGGFSGVIIDDWNKDDTSVTRQMYDAIKGKPVDANGHVYSTCPATTPYNKLYVVIYNSYPNSANLHNLDGVSFWYVDSQNWDYVNLDRDIVRLKKSWPHKEILFGIYLYNTHLKWLPPISVHYMLQHALDRYDDGDISGITLFPGPFLAKTVITLSQWNAYALPHWLDSLYYPYLGEGQGKLYDCRTGKTLTDAFVNVYCKGRVSGDTLMRTRQKTGAYGQYQFGLWAGNRNTDSTYYWLIAEKTGYKTDTVGFWIKRNSTTPVPSISLCPLPGNNTVNNNPLRLYPNPTHGLFTVLDAAQMPGDELEIYNLLGENVYSTARACSCSPVDLSLTPDGVYLVCLRNNSTKFTQKGLLTLVH